jgi:hypothetical protein
MAEGCSYLLLLSQPYSMADVLCNQISRLPNITCHGEVFAPRSKQGEKVRSQLGFSLDDAKADPSRFMRAVGERCERKMCAVVVMVRRIPRPAHALAARPLS